MDQLLKNEMQGMQDRIKGIENKMDKLYLALMGSDLTNDGGLVKRIIDLEVEVEKLKTEVEKDRKARIKTEVYVYFLWAVGGGLVVTIVSRVIELLK